MEQSFKQRFIQLNNSNEKRKYVKSVPDNIIKWGCDNLYPDLILHYYNNCVTLGSILDKKSKLMAGKSIRFEGDSFAEQFAKDIDFETMFYRCCLDYNLYNTICLQIESFQFRNEISSIYYQDVITARLTNNENMLAFNENWCNVKKEEIKYYNRFFLQDDEVKPGFLFWYEDGPGMANYTRPEYMKAETSIITEIKSDNAILTYMEKGAFPQDMYEVPVNMSDQEFESFIKQLRDMKGTDNMGGSLVTSFLGENGIKHTVLNVDINVEGLEKINVISNQKIMIACNVTNPTVLGLPAPAGLGDSGGTISVSMEQYMTDEIKPKREKLIRIFERLFLLAGYETKIIIE